MTYDLTGIDFDPSRPCVFERVIMTPIIEGGSQSEIQNTNWITYPYANHSKGGSWGAGKGSMIVMDFTIDIEDA